MQNEEEPEREAVLRDGSIVRIRPATDSDRPLLEKFVAELSEASLFERFVTELDRPEALRLLAPRPGSYILIAEREGKIIGHGEFHEPGAGLPAEVGVVVSDSFQGEGLGTVLLGELAEAAHDKGISVFHASLSPDNTAVISVLHDLGFPTSLTVEPGRVMVSLPTSVDRDTVLAFDRREAIASRAALQKFLNPTSVSVIGASRDPDSIGGRLFKNIIDAPFQGKVYPVNPNASVVQSVPAYKSILNCPGPVDLALIVVPAGGVLQVAKQCAQKGVKALTVISSGFAEVGKDGGALQQELVGICREYGMRLIGPNCMGLVNTDPKVNLNAQFSSLKPLAGHIGFLSQSGALGIAVIERANQLGLGLSAFVSVGNKADVSGNDLLEYWESDPNTDLILLYLESFGNPRKFGRIARRVTRKKPILAVKSGRTAAGFRATQSHTGALLAASDVTVEALFHQAGVIRADTLSEMFDVASLLACQPVPKGNRVAIVTNGGGAGIMAADACEGVGLKVPELGPEVQAELRTFLSREAGVRNPVDMIASATAGDFERAIGTVSKDPNIDSMIVLFIPPIAISPEDVASAILKSTAELRGRLTVVSTFMATHGIPDLLSGENVKVPTYPFPEAAARALSRAVGYGRWLSRQDQTSARPRDIRREEALGIAARNLSTGADWLHPEEARKLLDCYGIRVVQTVTASNPEEAGKVASNIGGKVVLKGVAEGLLHKTEAGAVMVGLMGEEQVRESAAKMASKLISQGFSPSGFLIQPMVEGGVEMIVGSTLDPTFGPVVACGAGGTLVELLKDVSVRLAPVSSGDAAEMLHELKTFPLLTGYRGGPVCDAASLEDVITRVSFLVDDVQEVAELDLNPVIVTPAGTSVVDFRIRLETRPQRVPLGAKSTA